MKIKNEVNYKNRKIDFIFIYFYNFKFFCLINNLLIGLEINFKYFLSLI